MNGALNYMKKKLELILAVNGKESENYYAVLEEITQFYYDMKMYDHMYQELQKLIEV